MRRKSKSHIRCGRLFPVNEASPGAFEVVCLGTRQVCSLRCAACFNTQQTTQELCVCVHVCGVLAARHLFFIVCLLILFPPLSLSLSFISDFLSSLPSFSSAAHPFVSVVLWWCCCPRSNLLSVTHSPLYLSLQFSPLLHLVSLICTPFHPSISPWPASSCRPVDVASLLPFHDWFFLDCGDVVYVHVSTVPYILQMAARRSLFIH